MAAADPYALCPCGSGKKFKWCCQPLEPLLEKGQGQLANNQIDAGLATFRQLTKDFPDNPQSWARYAQVLVAVGKTDDAEAALEKAFALSPEFPFGLSLRGMMRRAEGEFAGAAILFRRAVEAYHPDTHDQLAELYVLLAEAEAVMNRPLAAAHAARRAIAHSAGDAADEELLGQLGAIVTPSRFPVRTIAETPFRTDAGRAAPPDRLGAALPALLKAAADRPEDADAAFDAGLVLAYRGDNARAIEYLSRAGDLLADREIAAHAHALVCVLRCGEGLEQSADYVDHRHEVVVRDPNALLQGLQQLEQKGRLVATQANPEMRALSSILLQDEPTLHLSTGGFRLGKIAAYLYLIGNVLRFSHPRAEAVEAAVRDASVALGTIGAESRQEVVPVQFHDVTCEALRFTTRPPGLGEAQAYRQKVRDGFREFFEGVWLDRPLKSLGGLSPRLAAQNPANRNRLLGHLRFLDDCAHMALPPQADRDNPENRLYDFDALERLMGIADADAAPAAVSAPATAPAVGASPEEAFRAAQAAGDAGEAARLARELVAAEGDRYPAYQYLIAAAESAGDAAGALALLESAAADDRDRDAGKRRFDLAVRRARLLAGADLEAASAVLNEAFAAGDGEARHYAAAAEVFLGKRQGARALEFIDKGLAVAKKKNDRDAMGHLTELQGAAKRG